MKAIAGLAKNLASDRRETYKGAVQRYGDWKRTTAPGVALLSLHNPVARAARALTGRSLCEQASRAAREGLYWFSKALPGRALLNQYIPARAAQNWDGRLAHTR